MTPPTNKCCEKCGRLTQIEDCDVVVCENEDCPCHKPTEGCYGCARDASGSVSNPSDHTCKPTEPSVCDVRVQTAEGVNIPCRLPRPCKDHEKREVCGKKCPCGQCYRYCEAYKPCPLHEPSEVKQEVEYVVYCNEQDPNRGKFLFKCTPGCKHQPAPQQEEASWDAEANGEEELRHPITVLMFALHKILGDENWNEKIAPLLREAKAGVDELVAQAEKRCEVRALEWLRVVAKDEGGVGVLHAIKDRLTALKNPTHE